MLSKPKLKVKYDTKLQKKGALNRRKLLKLNYDGAGEGIRTLDVLLGRQALFR